MSELKPEGRTKTVSEEKVVEFKRKMEKSTKVYHDLFRLDPVETRKNVSFTDSPRWEPVIHGHFYHTVNSDGKALENSAPSAGHFHPVIVKYDGDKIVGVECGPPMVMHMGKAHPYANDKHTHDVSYIASEVVEKRRSNKDAVSVMAMLSKEENEANKNVAGIVK